MPLGKDGSGNCSAGKPPSLRAPRAASWGREMNDSMVVQQQDESDICQACGACCAYFRVSFYWAEAAARALPDQAVEQITPLLVCMAGTNQQQPRCHALAGEIGQRVSCQRYEERPSPCRELHPGDEKCNRARARYGLPLINVFNRRVGPSSAAAGTGRLPPLKGAEASWLRCRARQAKLRHCALRRTPGLQGTNPAALSVLARRPGVRYGKECGLNAVCLPCKGATGRRSTAPYRRRCPRLAMSPHTVVADGSLHGLGRDESRSGGAGMRGIEFAMIRRSLVKGMPETLQPW